MATVLTICVAAGCTSCDEKQADPGTSPASSGRLTLTDEVRLDEAEELLIKVCMERHGFRYWVGLVESVAERRSNGYVLTDVATARQHGYGGRLREQAENRKRREPNARYANALPETERLRYSTALFGDPEEGMLTADLPTGGKISKPRTGCLAEAEHGLYGDLLGWFRAQKIVTGVTSLYVPRLIEDPRFVTAVHAWSTCMSSAGHNYRTPAEIRERLPALKAGAASEQAHHLEVRLATAEATCATTTPLASTARELDREYRTAELAPYRTEIATYERMRATAVHRADQILSPTS